jgi:hypothetical protein
MTKPAMTLAYCYASGQIGFGKIRAKGALPLMRGPDKIVRETIEVHARHAYDGKTLLVPGLPEAPDSEDARLDALYAFLKRLRDVTKGSRVLVY